MAHVEAESDTGYYGVTPGMKDAKSRWDEMPTFGAGYASPGWKRAQSFTAGRAPAARPARHTLIEGDGRLLATADPKAGGDWSKGQRVFHQKFGYGAVTAIEGNKLLIDFEKAGEKKVIDTFVEKA